MFTTGRFVYNFFYLKKTFINQQYNILWIRTAIFKMFLMGIGLCAARKKKKKGKEKMSRAHVYE